MDYIESMIMGSSVYESLTARECAFLVFYCRLFVFMFALECIVLVMHLIYRVSGLK